MSTVDHKPGVISSVLNWLRKGYPEGVPPTDYFPLLALLRRSLTEDELDAIVSDLTSSGHFQTDRTVVVAAIERVAQSEPTDDEISQVAARLAAAGWPLAGGSDRAASTGHRSAAASDNGKSESAPSSTAASGSSASDAAPGQAALVAAAPDENAHPGSDSARPTLLRSILDWLHAGYPQGIPPKDYIPLVALLRRRLTDDETIWVAAEIVASGDAPADASDIGVLVTKVTNEMPSDADIDRVRMHLEERGWPVSPPSAS